LRNSKLKILLFILSYLFWNSSKGQDAMYSQTNHHQLFINPAYSGNSPYPRFMAGYRNQWPGLNNAFKSFYISYDQYLKGISSNIGISINRDIQGDGIISKTSGELIYSYPVELSENTIVSLGIQGGIVQKKINTSNLSLADPTEIIPQRTKIFPDFAVGAAFYFKEQYLLGIAVHHINSPQENEFANNNFTTPLQINIQAMAEFSFVKPFRSVNEIILTPGIYCQFQQKYNFITWGSNLRYNQIIMGLWFRNNILFNFNTIIVQMGYTTGALSFIYSYDAWSPINYQQFKIYGAHEVTFISHFKYNDPKKKMKTLKCPKI
jgi:type IX secretion system PorP/SprF family membrane protein